MVSSSGETVSRARPAYPETPGTRGRPPRDWSFAASPVTGEQLASYRSVAFLLLGARTELR